MPKLPSDAPKLVNRGAAGLLKSGGEITLVPAVDGTTAPKNNVTQSLRDAGLASSTFTD